VLKTTKGSGGGPDRGEKSVQDAQRGGVGVVRREDCCRKIEAWGRERRRGAHYENRENGETIALEAAHGKKCVPAVSGYTEPGDNWRERDNPRCGQSGKKELEGKVAGETTSALRNSRFSEALEKKTKQTNVRQKSVYQP